MCVIISQLQRAREKQWSKRTISTNDKISLKIHTMTTKKRKRKMLKIWFHNMSVYSLFFSSDDHKELLVCINSRHFNLCLGGLFALNNAEPTFKIILVRLHFARSQLFLFFYGIIVCIWIKMQIKCAVKVEHTGIDLKGEI